MTMESRSSGGVTARVVTGLVVVLLGLAFLGDNFGILRAEDVLRLWPFALIAVGLAKLFQDQSWGGRVFGGVLIFLGGLAAADQFLHVSLRLWRWWPVAIIVFGVLVLINGLRGNSADVSSPGAAPSGPAPRLDAGFEASTTAESTASEVAVWSGVKRRVSSPNFRSASLTAVMGGIEFDLRPAATATGEAVVEVFAIWGGIEIIVPTDWAVTTQVIPVLGGVEDRSAGSQVARHRLIVKGTVVMGGVEIRT